MRWKFIEFIFFRIENGIPNKDAFLVDGWVLPVQVLQVVEKAHAIDLPFQKYRNEAYA